MSADIQVITSYFQWKMAVVATRSYSLQSRSLPEYYQITPIAADVRRPARRLTRW